MVCTELGTGTSYVNRHGVTGLVVPPRDPDALVAAVNSLLINAEARNRMGVAARARVAAEFDLNVMIERVLALYQEVTRRT